MGFSLSRCPLAEVAVRESVNLNIFINLPECKAVATVSHLEIISEHSYAWVKLWRSKYLFEMVNFLELKVLTFEKLTPNFVADGIRNSFVVN